MGLVTSGNTKAGRENIPGSTISYDKSHFFEDETTTISHFLV
jgi:hypothetical protein